MRLFLQLLLLCTLSLQYLGAEEQPAQRGMVLFAAGDILLASHLPLSQPPHDYQIIYQLTLPAKEHQAVLAFLGTERQLALLPEPFDLRQLIDGDNFTVRAAIYYDHIERNVWYQDIPVRFARQLYKRALNQSASASEAHYDVLRIATSYFLIHQIATKPGFDQILRTEQAPPEPLILSAPADVTALQQLNAMGIQATQVYLKPAEER